MESFICKHKFRCLHMVYEVWLFRNETDAATKKKLRMCKIRTTNSCEAQRLLNQLLRLAL